MARRKDHTRTELQTLILQAAWDIIGKYGPAALTARQIATTIGYTPGTIYNIFTSMDDVLLHINARTLDTLYNILNSPACHAQQKTPIQNMKKMAALYMDFARTHRPYWLLLFQQDIPAHRVTQAWYTDKVDRLFHPLESLLTPYFSSRQAQKRTDTARTLWAAVHGLCFLQETGKINTLQKKTTAFPLVDGLIETYMAGLQTRI